MPVMAVSLPPATSSTPVTASGSIPETESQLSMAPSTGASAPASPAKSGSLAPQKEEVPVIETAVEKPATSKRRRDRKSKPKPKPKKKETAQCVGYYVDALDKKMLWGEARIIQCNLTTQKIKVHFVGWSKNYDLWTDPMSITAHGRYAPRTKDESMKSWDGDMHLFEDMLGAIEESTFTPVPVPAEDKLQVTPAQPPAKKKAGEKKRAPSERKASTEKKTSGVKKAPSEKKISSPKVATARQPERSAAKRKAAEIVNDKPSSESTPVITKPAASNAKRAAVVLKGKENLEKNQEPSRNTKRQKREVPQKATAAVPATGKSRSGKKKKKTPTHDELPLFRDLELEDGTVMDFSKQREEARVKREAMQSFLDRCALIWKKQLSAVSVQ
ncbi:hypothetical protein PF010_g415 [Phytophthora fragariae]|uniref:Tudor-knot domain-containing protein n=1 Tax=Phytophthora fragariae TaxID=53985 RepID=A0A6G0PVD8_9STRA|nr:hypothetical protein PF010_g415 [Phytophthora fragariae]KAE9255877.1 hypothetical protein PF004_g377 [Phytophthora fragariae]